MGRCDERAEKAGEDITKLQVTLARVADALRGIQHAVSSIGESFDMGVEIGPALLGLHAFRLDLLKRERELSAQIEALEPIAAGGPWTPEGTVRS